MTHAPAHELEQLVLIEAEHVVVPLAVDRVDRGRPVALVDEDVVHREAGHATADLRPREDADDLAMHLDREFDEGDPFGANYQPVFSHQGWYKRVA